MFTYEEIQNLAGAAAYDRAGQKIGQVSAVYADRTTGKAEWLTVKTGLFGTKESFVPLALARARDAREVELAAYKDTITSAPKIEPEGGLSRAEEEQLFSHYGLGYSEWRGQAGLPETSGVTTGSAYEAPVAPGHDTSVPATGDAMTRSEERVHVGTVSEETGRARLRKYVVTETVQQTVPVSHEEVRVEREPITEANIGEATAGPDISEEEHEVTLHAERPVTVTETVPVERVRLAKDRVADEETVTSEIRKEQIQTEADGDTGILE